jgi:hypothetical protein
MIQEFEQIEKLNYTKTFVSMIKSMNYKTMYVIIVVKDWKIEQMNVKTIFLYDKILENVYVVQLTNFEKNVNQVCKLNKALYDLKQSLRIWFETLIKKFFSELRFVWRRIQCFYEKRHHDRHLCKRFDFYEIQFRNNLLIEECSERTFRNERFKFVYLLFRHDDLQKSKSQTINFESKRLRWTNVMKSWNVKLQIINHFHERLVSFNKNFWRVYCWQKLQNQLSINREIIDVHHAKNSIEHSLFYFYVFNFIQIHWQAVKRIFRYLRKTHQMKLMFRKALKSLKNYTNSSWIKNQNIRRSISKYVFNVDNDVIKRFSKRQLIVTLSICEIVYTKQILIAKKAIWLRNLMTQLRCDVEYFQTMIIYENNQNVIVLIKNSQFHARIKHIDIQTYFIKKKMIEKFIDLIYVFIDQMIIDDLTKSLIKDKFVQFRAALEIE